MAISPQLGTPSVAAWVFLEGHWPVLLTHLVAQCRAELGNRRWEGGLLKDGDGGAGGECTVSGGGRGEKADFIFHACFFLLAFLGNESGFFFF